MTPEPATLARVRFVLRVCLRIAALVLFILGVALSATRLYTWIQTMFGGGRYPGSLAWIPLLQFWLPAIALLASDRWLLRWLAPMPRPACPECGYTIAPDTARCPECGLQLRSSTP